MVEDKEKILFLSGFGDNSTLFKPLHNTELAKKYELIYFNLPGFGAPRENISGDIQSLANYLHSYLHNNHINIVVAHSVASIIASFAAEKRKLTLISVEGNLTKHDAYFSGKAAGFVNPDDFFKSFVEDLGNIKKQDPILERYLQQVLTANKQSLWELGCDAHRVSNMNCPGEKLKMAERVLYLYNSENCHKNSIKWLKENQNENFMAMEHSLSHWPTIDNPKLISDFILDYLTNYSGNKIKEY